MSPERADAEARAYEQVAKVAPDKIPAIHGYDSDNYALVMEDMSDLEVLRTILNEGGTYGPDTSRRIGEFVAQLSFSTSDFGMPSAERKALIAASVSPELCKITEDVVLSEPYLEHEHNHWHPGLDDLAAAFRSDPRLRTEVAELRHLFMTGAQALLHGDLHTGSIMVGTREGAPVVRVFDPEFSFVGPIGFDLGLYWANTLVSAARADALGVEGDHGDQLRLSWDAFGRSSAGCGRPVSTPSSTTPSSTASWTASGRSPWASPARRSSVASSASPTSPTSPPCRTRCPPPGAPFSSGVN